MFLAVMGVVFSQISEAAAEEKAGVVIIGNRTLPFDSLSQADLVNIFKQRKTMWDADFGVNIALLKDGETHKQFLWTYFRKTPAQYRRYWKKLVFSGKGRTPMTFRSEKDLMAHVALTKGAIGYVAAGTKLVGVKQITIQN